VAGNATVTAEFDELECRIGKERGALDGYAFDADYMATERFAGTLLIQIQKHKVNVEETDGMVLRLQLDQLLDVGIIRADDASDQIVPTVTTAPLTLDLSTDEDDTNASLSLFQTCPEFPTHEALSGEVRFDIFALAIDPDDTGRGEHLAGTVTATLTRANATGRVGDLRAEFDFLPPRRPLTDHR
jgi:hypothetical protein